MKILFYLVLTALLSGASVTDLKHRKIPNCIPAAILLLGLLAAALQIPPSLSSRAAGFFAVSLPLLVCSLLFPGAFGGGDIKLMAAAGGCLGFPLILNAFALSMMAAGAYLPFLLLKGRSRGAQIPLAPFFTIGILTALLGAEGKIHLFFL